jgi:hypothetical protein
MRQLTKNEKIEAYTYAMITILDETDDFPLVCCNLEDWLLENDIEAIDVLDYFPEFLKQKPKGKTENRAWWPYGERTKRLKALGNAITLVK